jgi:hypothetical protein
MTHFSIGVDVHEWDNGMNVSTLNIILKNAINGIQSIEETKGRIRVLPLNDRQHSTEHKTNELMRC